MFPQALVPLPPETFHSLVQSLYILATLDVSRLYSLCVAHPAALDKLLLSISPELEAEEMGARFRLLDLLLVEGATPSTPPKPALPLLAQDEDGLEECMHELLECLSNPSQSLFGLAASNLLLLDSIDQAKGKRTLHRLLMAKLAELAAISPSARAAAAAAAASSSSSSSDEPRSPARQLSTESLSRFSQELITLVNSGRLPPQWVDEGEVTRQHSGTNRAQANSDEIDLFQSTRAEVRPPPERDPSCSALTRAALSFLAQLFATDTALELLYTNDIAVLVEVLLRRVEDDTQDDPALTLEFLMTLSSIVSWPEFATNPFKTSEIRALLRTVKENFSSAATKTAEQTEAMNPEQLEEHENRLAVYELAQVMLDKVDKL